MSTLEPRQRRGDARNPVAPPAIPVAVYGFDAGHVIAENSLYRCVREGHRNQVPATLQREDWLFITGRVSFDNWSVRKKRYICYSRKVVADSFKSTDTCIVQVCEG